MMKRSIGHGTTFAISIILLFVLSLSIGMKPEMMQITASGQLVGLFVIGTILLMMFGPLVPELIDILKDIKEWSKRSRS